jgi:hypothetical protein
MQPSSPQLPQGSKQPKNHIAINPSPSPTKRIAMEKRSSISQTFGQSPKVLRIGVEPDVRFSRCFILLEKKQKEKAIDLIVSEWS